MESFKELTPHQLRLRFFDVTVDIRADSNVYTQLFAQMYARFQMNQDEAVVPPPLEFTILSKSDNPWGQPVIILDGDVQPLHSLTLLAGYVYEILLYTMISRVRSHFLIHAGVVSHAGQGLMVVADATHGKTTLVLELIRRGFSFLSDEMAALGRSDRLVHPFPRSLRIRPDTLELVGFPPAAAGTTVWVNKLILDIEQIRPGSLGQAVPINHIIILRDPAEAKAEETDPSTRELRVLVDRLDEDLLAAIRRLETVVDLQLDFSSYSYPLLKLRTPHRISVLAQVEALCRERQVMIVDVIKRIESHPTFETPARLEPIPRSQAVMEILQRFQGGHKSALLQAEFGGSSTRLFIELATLIQQTQCYHLFVGPLSPMADLVSGLLPK